MGDNSGVEHSVALIETIAIGLGAGFVGGIIAYRLGLPTIVGYLLAGVAIGPFTPGLVADTGTAAELAEIGVILLMFGVGIHFSINDLLAVRNVAIPGAIGQIFVATLLGDRARGRPRVGACRRAGARPGGVGREHDRAAAGTRTARRGRLATGTGRHRLADRRRPLHGPRARPAADAGADAARRGRRAWPTSRSVSASRS